MLPRSRSKRVWTRLEIALERAATSARFASRAFLLGIVIGGPCVAFEVQSGEPRWHSHYAAEAGFRVDVPAEVSHDTDEHWSLAGKIRMHRYAIRHPGARLDLEYHVIPRVALLVMSSSHLLDQARDGLMKDLGVDPESEEEISLQGHPGRKLLFRRAHLPGPEETRIYLVGRYLYLVSAGPWHPELREGIVDRFFESLRLCPTNPQECGPVGATGDLDSSSPRGVDRSG